MKESKKSINGPSFPLACWGQRASAVARRRRWWGPPCCISAVGRPLPPEFSPNESKQSRKRGRKKYIKSITLLANYEGLGRWQNLTRSTISFLMSSNDTLPAPLSINLRISRYCKQQERETTIAFFEGMRSKWWSVVTERVNRGGIYLQRKQSTGPSLGVYYLKREWRHVLSEYFLREDVNSFVKCRCSPKLLERILYYFNHDA